MLDVDRPWVMWLLEVAKRSSVKSNESAGIIDDSVYISMMSICTLP